MSLIIKGLDMPKDCDRCPFILYNWNKHYWWCGILDKPSEGEKRDDCPLIEIPTPHGRLIDGDMVADMLDSMMVHKTLHNAFDEVLNMPTILESED